MQGLDSDFAAYLRQDGFKEKIVVTDKASREVVFICNKVEEWQEVAKYTPQKVDVWLYLKKGHVWHKQSRVKL